MSHQDQVTVKLNTPKATATVVNISDTTAPASTVNFVGPQGPAGPAGPSLLVSGEAENRVLTWNTSGSNSEKQLAPSYYCRCEVLVWNKSIPVPLLQAKPYRTIPVKV